MNVDLPPYDDVPLDIIQFEDDEMDSPQVASSSPPSSALVPHVDDVSPLNVPNMQPDSGEG